MPENKTLENKQCLEHYHNYLGLVVVVEVKSEGELINVGLVSRTVGALSN